MYYITINFKECKKSAIIFNNSLDIAKLLHYNYFCQRKLNKNYTYLQRNTFQSILLEIAFKDNRRR